MKLLILLFASIVGFESTATAYRGGDMPFPIGSVIDIPIKDMQEDFWVVPKIDRYLKINYLEIPTSDGNLQVQLYGYKQLSVIADGIGKVGADKILRSILKYRRQSRYVSVTVGSYCLDAAPAGNAKSFSLQNCLQPRYMVGFEQITGNQKSKMRAYSMTKTKRIQE